MTWIWISGNNWLAYYLPQCFKSNQEPGLCWWNKGTITDYKKFQWRVRMFLNCFHNPLSHGQLTCHTSRNLVHCWPLLNASALIRMTLGHYVSKDLEEKKKNQPLSFWLLHSKLYSAIFPVLQLANCMNTIWNSAKGDQGGTYNKIFCSAASTALLCVVGFLFVFLRKRAKTWILLSSTNSCSWPLLS